MCRASTHDSRPSVLVLLGCFPSELNEPRFVRVQCEPELRKARRQGLLHPMRIAPALEGQHEVIGVAYQPYPTRRMAPLTLPHPQVQGVVQEDVRKQRADARALGSLVRMCVDSTLHDAAPSH